MTLEAPERLLSILVQHPGGSAPPERADFDVRAARAELERRGHHIDAVAASPSGSQAMDGEALAVWRLRCAREHFSPQRFIALRASRFGETLHVWEQCDSTNSLASMVATQAAHGTVWLSEAQLRGRGRQGRQWVCPAHAGLLFSVLLRPTPAGAEPGQLLPLAIALGVCEGLRRSTGCDVLVKWPNDLVLGDRKLGGVLVEARRANPPYAIVGCGINVDVDRQFMRRQGISRVSSLQAGARALPQREAILAQVLACLEEHYDACRSGRREHVLERWRRYDALRGRRVRVEGAAGTERGTALGIAPEGALEVRLDDGTTRRFVAGEVHLT